MTLRTKNNLIVDKEELAKRDYMNISIGIKNTPEKNKVITVRKLVNCSECSKVSIVSLNLDFKLLKKVMDEENPVEKNEDINKLLKALVSVPAPKRWKKAKE